MPKEIIFRSPLSESDFEKYYKLRWRILRKPWGQPKGSELNERDADAFHILAELENNVIGVGCIHEIEKGVGRIRFMGVDDDYRNQGIGETIVKLLEQHAKSQNWLKIKLFAREIAILFYQNIGYNIIGDGELLFGVIKHKIMEKHI